MARKPIVSYREPTTQEVVQTTLPDWVPSVIVFLLGMILFVIVELMMHA